MLVEDHGAKILIDPGSFSFEPGVAEPGNIKGINAILVTHPHYDHLDVGIIKEMLANNPQCVVYANSDSMKMLEDGGVACELFEDSEREIAGFKIKAFFAAHEPILKRSMPKNTAFLIDEKFLHPGDSYATEVFQYAPEVLALAVAGPWMNMNQGFDFTQKCHSKIVLPMHDGHIKEFFSIGMYDLWEKFLGEQGVKFEKLLKPGDSVEI